MMGYYDEEFFDEPSEFESQIISLKETLAQSIKKEFLAEMTRLQSENVELQKIKHDWESIQSEYKEKHRQLEFERKDMERKLRRERLSNLMKDFEVVMYQVHANKVSMPKCDKCNKWRKVEYITPLGRKAQEDCECANRKTVFEPKECRCSEFKISPDGNTLSAWYKMVVTDDYDYASPDSHFAQVIYHEGMNFEEIDKFTSYNVYFKTQEECQLYCDYLNSKVNESK